MTSHNLYNQRIPLSHIPRLVGRQLNQTTKNLIEPDKKVKHFFLFFPLVSVFVVVVVLASKENTKQFRIDNNPVKNVV